jgi:tRNA pseudouridine55 synthase
MDGLLVVDKPIGPTSHDIVALARRALRETRIGHTGTLDPAASGVLPLVLGKATRLARFLSSGDKVYEARITLGVSTDTYDATGTAVGSAYAGALPGRPAVDSALMTFKGTILQQPPAFSAKKIGGMRSHRLARAASREAGLGVPSAAAPVELTPAEVTLHRADVLGVAGAIVTLLVECSAGFYVRSLAHDLGKALGTGGHLSALRRLKSCGLTLDDCLSIDDLGDAARVSAALVPPQRMLPEMQAFTLTDEGARQARHGRALPGSSFVEGDAAQSWAMSADTAAVCRLLDRAGTLLGLASPGREANPPAFLHPFVVLV